MSAQARAMETTFKALADATRLRIVGLLMTGEVCVCHLQASLKLPQPKVSRHLSYFKRAGLVQARKEGLWNHYRLTDSADPIVRTLLSSVKHCLNHLDGTERDRVRLQRATGCCAEMADTPLSDCACCQPAAGAPA